jgi:hypothetical protein
VGPAVVELVVVVKLTVVILVEEELLHSMLPVVEVLEVESQSQVEVQGHLLGVAAVVVA